MSTTADTLIKVNDTASYREKLSSLEAAKYDEKLKRNDGCDPYQTDSNKWSTDVDLLPPVQYYDVQHHLLYTHSAYIHQGEYAGIQRSRCLQSVYKWLGPRTMCHCMWRKYCSQCKSYAFTEAKRDST
ncbi:hypothetical protein DPMN_119336 [Dreissena polymorpha]|uniref:Uncharacterized protein n=1 Tax=Dreissena polymorpha TaxID=45954 RepID=A0A9D4GLU4_DREPO|nr:hypothetical protein DPMN_119336 [Dreissena polymorpha]